MKKRTTLPAAFAAPSRDTRFAGTYEVLVPVRARVRPLRVPLQFSTLESAQSWIHTPEGREAIEKLLNQPRA